MEMFNDPALDARMKGVYFSDIPTGESTVEYIFPFDCLFNGLTVSSSVTQLGSTVKLETYYNAGPHGWKRYKKFADSFNLFPGSIDKNILFPTKPKSGVKILITVNNNDGVAIDLALNLFQFTDVEKVDTQILQEGEDW